MSNEAAAQSTTSAPVTTETVAAPVVAAVVPPAAVAPVTPVVATTTTEVKPPAETAAAKVVPDKYELKLPDGSKLDAKVVEDVSAYAKSLNLSNEQAQELLNRQDGTIKSYADSIKTEFEAKIEGWKTQTIADKEIGGDNISVSTEMAKRALTKYATPDFIKILDDTGFGNHPEVVRAFARIGKAMQEDKVVTTGTQSGEQKNTAAKFYPNNN